MALHIPHSIFHLARLLYVRPETFGPYCVSFRYRVETTSVSLNEKLIISMIVRKIP